MGIKLEECRHCHKDYPIQDMIAVTMPRFVPKVMIQLGTKTYMCCHACAMKVYQYMGDNIEKQ